MALRKYEPDQGQLFWASPEQALPPDHLCFVVDELVEQLDFCGLPDRRTTPGHPAYDPRLLVKVLFYGYATGTTSGRELMKACREQLPYIYLTRQQYPNFRTICDFRKQNRRFMQDAFVQIVQMAQELGLAKLGTVALDATHMRANASRSATIKADDIDREIERALKEAIRRDEEEDEQFGRERSGEEQPEGLRTCRQRLKRLRETKKRLAQKKRNTVNTTDPEATFHAQGTALIPSYNAQAVVNEYGLIVDACVRDNPADHAGLEQALENLRRNLGKKPSRLLADSGFYSCKNLQTLKEQGIEGYLPSTQQARDAKAKFSPQHFSKDKFGYDAQRDSYVCPLGEELGFWREDRGSGTRYYRGRACAACPARGECIRGKRPFRTVCRSAAEQVMQEMRERMESEEGKAIYARRKVMIEPPFGHFKHNLRFRQFFTRGLQAVQSEWLLLCIGLNIRKLSKWMKGRGLPSSPQSQENRVPPRGGSLGRDLAGAFSGLLSALSSIFAPRKLSTVLIGR